MTSRYGDLEGKFNGETDFLGVLSLGSVVLSGILLFTPVKAVGYIGMGGGLGAFSVSVIARKKHLKVAKQYIDDLVAQQRLVLLKKDDELVEMNGTINHLNGTINGLTTKVKTLETDSKTQGLSLSKAQDKIQSLTVQNQAHQQLIEQVTGELDGLIDLARTAVEESIDEWNARLNSLVSTKRERYPKLTERLNELLQEGESKLCDYALKLAETPKKWDSLADLLSLFYCLNDDLQNIKTKAIQAISRLTLQQKELEIQEIDVLLEEWQSADLIPREKVQGLISKYEAMLQEFRLDLKKRFEGVMNVKGQLEAGMSSDEEFFLRLRMQIQRLEGEVQQLQEKVNHLSKPLEYRPATRADMKTANIFIRYFQQLGIILDRAGIDYKHHESTLWFFTDRNSRLILADDLNEHSDKLQALSHCLNSPTFKLDPESGLIYVTVVLSKKPTASETDISLLVGSALEFIEYITSHPIRYRLIADPGEGKTPTTAVMLSAILKAGCKRGNVSKGAKVPYTLVTVSYPGVQSSLKDSDYPLDLFLEYGTEASAVKSFQVALEDWEYRRKNIPYAEQFFQLWVWDEFDNTVNSSSDPQALADRLKLLLKQGGHNNIGWIVSGQSVMTKQIPGFTNDDRSLFTETIIGIPKIRHYLNTYGKGKNSDSNLAKLSRNLEQIEEYIEQKNGMVTDDARLLRVALVVDSRSPKLYFLPNLDCVTFDTNTIEETRKLARQFRDGDAGMSVSRSATRSSSSADIISASRLPSPPEKSPIGGRESQPHCPECGSANVKPQSQNRYKCGDCGARRVESKMVWK